MSQPHPQFIVGVGGSAGALSAYKALVDALPSDTGMAFIIASQIQPVADSLLAEVLSRRTKMPVRQAAKGMPIQANHVYVMPPNAALQVKGYAFTAASRRTNANHPVDLLFMSLAEAWGARAIGIIFSGYGDDGTKGCQHIQANGGATFAQDFSAEVDGMPLSAQASGGIDFVLPPGAMPDALRSVVRRAAGKQQEFDPKKFLAVIGEGRTIVRISQKQYIYAQGEAADAVFYVQKGNVRLTVVSKGGKSATLGVLGPGTFCGEGCLTGQARRLGSAIAMTDCELMRIEKKAMLVTLHDEQRLSDLFTAYLLGRNIRYEAELVDQLFSSSEKRLARTLLLLAHFGAESTPETIVPKISQETLAEMIGTTRSRVNFFMNKFKKLGFIEYNGVLKIKHSLLTIVVHD
ncbi:MAG: chemotaxis protein CheB [Vicinamibacterales bacterium]